MAYTIDRYNNVTLTTVEDGTIDQTTDLKLVGKNYAGYGEIQNENFVFLLENFAGGNAPPKAISGQIWFDSNNSKLKFYDGSQWRTTGGAEISATAPSGLSTGDFWWDTSNEQLYAYNGSDFVLVGPQDAGDGITQMQSRTVRDTTATSRSIITATINDEVIFVISAHVGDGTGFQIDSSDAENAIAGFDVIRPGVTLKNTISATGGVTSTAHRYWGTASNALKLGGFDASDYVRTGSGSGTTFTELVNFQTDAGIAIGLGLDLKLFVENDNEVVMANNVGTKLKFRAKQTGTNLNIVEMSPGAVLPGRNNADTGVNTVDIGASGSEFNNVYATTFTGTATQSNALVVGGSARTGNVGTAGTGTPNTVAVRDASGNLNAVLFQGTATSARYADLAEKYTTNEELPVGTAVAVCGHEDHEVEPASASQMCIGVVSAEPAYLMNSEAEGQAIGLKGRVPVRVQGPVKKGQAVYAWAEGICRTIETSGLVGIALESSDDDSEKLIECVLKV
jgi:hypothetical protein